MKKLISMLLVAVVLFNFIFGNQAKATEAAYDGKGDIGVSPSDLKNLVEGGESAYGENHTKVSPSLTGNKSTGITIMGILAGFITLFPNVIRYLMYVCIGTKTEFTIERAVFGEIALFDVDYFNMSDPYEYKLGNAYKKTISIPSTATAPVTLRKSVAEIYYIVRLIAAAISLLILLYVGIRMAVATISADKAKYKKMLIGWLESVLILFLMQYIIVAIFGIGRIFINLVYDLKEGFMATGDVGFETYILNQISEMIEGNAGWTYVLYCVIFWVLVGIQTKFFILYFKRLITVGFLVLISPLITITYPIDKIGDGKAQAFSVWLNELMMNVFIQPIHGLIYLVFMFTAGEIAKQSVWVAVIFLLSLTRIEKIILRLFDLRKVTSLRPVDEQSVGKD